MVGCCAPNCQNRSEKGFRLFCFPANKDRRQRWFINCRRDKWTPNNASRLCEEHFEPSQFEANRADGWKKLKPNAIPTIFNVPNPPRLLESKRRILRLVNGATEHVSAVQRSIYEHTYHNKSVMTKEQSDLQVPSILPEQSENVSDHFINSKSCDSQSTLQWQCNNDVIVSGDSFADFGVAVNVEAVTSQPSPRKHLQLKNQVDTLTKRTQQLIRNTRVLKRQLKASNAANRVLKQKLKKIFSDDQISVLQSTKTSNRGRRWSLQTIQKSLQIAFACGQTGYKVLRDQGYPIPASRTLRKSLEGLQFNSGILNEVFHVLGLKVKQLKEKEKDCCLTLDEMSITPSVEYDTRTGRLMGEVTLPGHSGKATHAMVFMLAGISTRWKQTVAYYFTGNSVYGTALKPIILNIIRHAAEIGLRVISVTSDMGACNRAMWNSFGIQCGRLFDTVNHIPHPCFPDCYLYFLADAPHVIKNLKAALVNGQDFVLPDWAVQEHKLCSNTVTAGHLRQLQTFQENLPLKLSPGLTAKTLTPSHFDKMKVSNAMSFFSHSNSAALQYLVDTHGYSEDLLTTAWFLKTINHWFDLMSSRRRIMALSLKDPVRYHEALDFLRTVIRLFETISIGKKAAWKPVQTGIILSTQSIIEISEHLLSSGYKFILSSRFTSDCIENLFSCVRTNNSVPSSLEFKNKLRLITASQFLRVKATTSYDVDNGSYLAEFLSSNKPSTSGNRSSTSEYVADDDDDVSVIVSFSDAFSMSDAEMSSLYYLAGYVVSRVLKNNRTCKTCADALKTDSNVVGHEAILLHLKSYRQGCLVSCTSETFELFKQAEQVFRATNLSLVSHKKNVRKILLNRMQQASADVTLPDCHNVKSVMLSRFVTLRLRIWAKDQRELLKNQLQKTNNGELGSKSMAMRMAVGKFK